jgi:hypothetical protein
VEEENMKAAIPVTFALLVSFAPALHADQDPLLDALHAARKAGDEELARSIQQALGWSAGRPAEPAGRFLPAEIVIREDLRAGMTGATLSDRVRPDALQMLGQSGRWQTDVRVSEEGTGVDFPDMAAHSDGTLYVVCESTDGRDYLDIYTSSDDGATWDYWMSLMGGMDHLSNPSIAVAEGDSDQLLIAYEKARGTTSAAIWVHRLYLGTPLGQAALIESYPLDHRWPSLCVDFPEYNYWYPYIVYASEVAGEPDTYQIRFRRSFDYGGTWTNPEILATVYNTGDYGAQPHIDYGDYNLYAVYDETDVATDDRDILLRRSTNLGGVWDPEVTLAATSDDESAPRVAATNGGGAVVVCYDRLYTSPVEQYDVEAYYSQDAGDSWGWTYPPYSPVYDEWGADLCVSPSYGKIHVAFWRYGDIIYTWVDHTSPYAWAAEVDVNEGAHASMCSAPAITVNPTKSKEACVAWSDVRSYVEYQIYFDTSYLYGELAGVEETVPGGGALRLLSMPDPIRSAGRVLFQLPAEGPVSLVVTDPAGRMIARLLDGWLPPGVHHCTWDVRAGSGLAAPSGVYYYRLRTESGELTRRVTLLR